MTNLGVEKYEILATLDRKTSDICRHMDGKIFDMKDFKIGITAPPLHVWCRSCTIPHVGEKLKNTKRAARDDDQGKTYYIDGNMKYEDWKKVFVDKSMSYKSWQDKQKNDIIKANIASLAKENHIRFESVDYPPKKLEINISNFSFDDEHINKEREHNVTRKEAEMFIRQAMFSLVRWKGRYICYFSSKGSTYVDINDKKIRTSYHREQFDENTLIFIEGVENIGIKNN